MTLLFNNVTAILVTMMTVLQIFANHVMLLVTNAADPTLITALIVNQPSLEQ